jgi:transcriptional regulator with XRE-family HTH domain
MKKICQGTYYRYQMKQDEREKLAEIVRKLRGRRSKRVMADILGVSHPTITAWENCEVDPEPENLRKIAELRGQSFNQLIADLQQPTAIDPFEQLVAKLPLQIKGMSRSQLSQLLQAIAEGLAEEEKEG